MSMLAPLDPEQFLVWAWSRAKGTAHLTVADFAFDFRVDEETARKWVVAVAARVRRNQRLGRGF